MKENVRQQVSEKIHAAYTRILVSGPDADSSPIAAQERTLRSLANAHGHDIDAVFTDDGVSGAREARPGLDALLREIRAGRVAAVYVTKLDRLSRSLAHLFHVVQLFKKQKVALISAAERIDTSTSVGRMMLNLLGTFAEFERERIAERCADASADRRRNGQVYGPPAYGYAVQGTRLVPNDREQSILGQMRQARTLGQTYAAIATDLNARGVLTKRGRHWYPETVRSVLTSAINQV